MAPGSPTTKTSICGVVLPWFVSIGIRVPDLGAMVLDLKMKKSGGIGNGMLEFLKIIGRGLNVGGRKNRKNQNVGDNQPKIPKSEGDEVYWWLIKVEEYFGATGTLEVEKLPRPLKALRGCALSCGCGGG